MSRRLRVGVIGAGSIASGVHIPNYKRHEDRVELAAVADVNRAKAEACAARFGISGVYDSYEAMLREAQLDAVSICTPNKFHASAAIAALEAGCHVLCEKPPAMSYEEALRMEQAAQRCNRLLTYGFHYRYAEEVQVLRRYIEAGELGEVYMAKVTAVRRRGIPAWGVFTSKELQGGGALCDIGVHMLDTALYLMGYPEVDRVMASTYQKLGNRPGVGDWDWEQFSVEDLAVGMIVFKNGASLLLETAFAVNVGPDKTMQVSLAGDQGGADVFPLKLYQEKHGTLVDVQPVGLKAGKPRDAELAAFVDSCLGGPPPLSHAAEGTALQRIVEELYRSAELGEAIRLQG